MIMTMQEAVHVNNFRHVALFLNLVRAGLSYKDKDLQNKALFEENW